MVFDETQGALTITWRIGGPLYGALGRIEAWKGASSWEEALSWIARFRREERIAELQFWGQGTPGCLYIASDTLDMSALETGHPLNP